MIFRKAFIVLLTISVSLLSGSSFASNTTFVLSAGEANLTAQEKGGAATPTPTPTPTVTCAPKLTGGGQIPIPNPDSTQPLATGTGRATFGFNSQPEKDCTDGGAKGHFNYVNHVSGLHVDGKVLNSQLIAPNTVRFSGECGAGCTFTVTVQDNGEPGTLDTFGLTVTGTKNEVRSLRVISRGNIQFHF
jgi:hypothetical protein